MPKLSVADIATIFVMLLVVAILAACSSTSPRQTGSPTPSPAGSPTSPALTVTSPTQTNSAIPAQTPTVEPTAPPSAQPNLLSFAGGALVRRWPAQPPVEGWPAALLFGNTWRTAPGTNGPFEFVFELPVEATIERVGFGVPTSTGVPAIQHASVEVSTASSATGFKNVGSYDIRGDALGEQGLSLSAPTRARWIRITFSAPPGGHIEMQSVSAYGSRADAQENHSIAGTWLLDDQLKLQNDPAFASGSLPDRLQLDARMQRYAILHIIQHGNDVQFVACTPYYVSNVWHGWIAGSSIQLQNQNGTPYVATLNSEGTTLVGTDNSNTFPFVAFQLAVAPPCLPHATVGTGKIVLVIGSGYPPADAPAPAFQGYRFVSIVAPLLPVNELSKVDTAVLGDACDATHIFADWQKQALIDFVQSGGKLIIHDSDRCHNADYSFLPYPFTLSVPGRLGAHGKDLKLVESDTLGSDRSDPAHFLDVQAYVAGIQDLGDANVVLTRDSHWCGHLFNINAFHANGFTQMYAHLGKGMIIYDGLDADDFKDPPNQRLLRLELDQPPSGFLPCTQMVSGGFIIAPSVHRTIGAGAAQTLRFPLKVFANAGWSGDVRLAVASPNTEWPAHVSPPSVLLHGDVKSAAISIEIPASVGPGTYTFTVTGTAADNLTAHADITLEADRAPAIAKQLATSRRVAVYGIYFDFDSDRLRAESDPVLREIAQALAANPEWNLTIEGHTDDVGGPTYNLALSQRRAAAVMSALIERYHVKATRLSAVGYGATRPKASNATDAGRALNRRVELVRR